jgi:hypothetical protein
MYNDLFEIRKKIDEANELNQNFAKKIKYCHLLSNLKINNSRQHMTAPLKNLPMNS